MRKRCSRGVTNSKCRVERRDSCVAMIEAPPSPKPSIKPHRVERNSSMIVVRLLAKRIDQQDILRGVNLDVPTGETLAIIGRSGGGKSVLLKHLVGLMEPNSGEIWIEGKNITGMNERELGAVRRKIGILFQGGALFDSMTVEENIAFPLREAGERNPEKRYFLLRSSNQKAR